MSSSSDFGSYCGWSVFKLFGADGSGEHTQSTQGISKHNLRTGRPYLTRLDRSNALKLIPHQAGTKQSISFHAIILIAIGEYNDDRNDNNKDHDDDGKTGGKTVMNCIFIIFACKHWLATVAGFSTGAMPSVTCQTNPSQIGAKYLTFRQSDNHQMRICWMTKVT